MSQIRYTKDHEYIRVEGDEGVVGISEHAQSQLGDVVFAETPPVGKTLKAGDAGRRGRERQGGERRFRPGVGRSASRSIRTWKRRRASSTRTRSAAAGCFASSSPMRTSSSSLMDEAAYADYLKTLG